MPLREWYETQKMLLGQTGRKALITPSKHFAPSFPEA
jgi:hypothetical protein